MLPSEKPEPSPLHAVGLDAAAALAEGDAAALLRASLSMGPVEFRAAGISMRPLLRSGDTVRVEARRPARGDVVLAVVGERLVLHRVIGVRGGGQLRLRGDARVRADGWIAAEAVLGVVTARRTRPAERSRHAWRPLDRTVDRVVGLALASAQRLLRPLRPVPGDRAARRGAASRAAGRSRAAG